jgi:arylsulfatase A-like enzyme
MMHLHSYSLGRVIPALVFAVAAQAAESRPNVVLIVADDLGYADLGFNGTKDVATPHIDALAREGVHCTNAYVTHSVCSPSRAGLITGRHQSRWGHDSNWSDFGLPPSETTMGGRMQTLGYTTAIVGKWHLGTAIYANPKDDEATFVRGFDELFLTNHNATYFEEDYLDSRGSGRFTKLSDPTGYTPDVCAERGADFIRRSQGKPFFLYLPLNSVHENFYAPERLEAPQKYLDRVSGIADTKRRLMAAMVIGLDEAVGTVMRTLRDTGADRNTLVVFTNDNGGSLHLGPQVSLNTPFRGGKGDFLEGGLRVPMVMHWPGQLPADTVYAAPVSTLDMVPTVVAAAGGTIDPAWQLDGVNLLPHVRGQAATAPHETLCWRRGPDGAIRQGSWKLLIGPGKDRQLYDLASDPGETTNRAAQHGERVAALESAWNTWEATMGRPQPIAPPKGFSAPWFKQAH